MSAIGDLMQQPNESQDAWFARLRAFMANVTRTCEGVDAHPWTDENVRTRPNGTGYCIPCSNARRREKRQA